MMHKYRLVHRLRELALLPVLFFKFFQLRIKGTINLLNVRVYVDFSIQIVKIEKVKGIDRKLTIGGALLCHQLL